MSPFPRMVSPEDTLVYARDLMLWGEYRHLLVASKGDLVGVLSMGDIAQHQARTGESIFSNPSDTVAMAMTPEPETVAPADDLEDICRRMAKGKLGCMPVIRSGGVIGIITTIDVLAASAGRTKEKAPDGPTVGEAMTRQPKTINSNDSLMDAANRMRTYQIRHLPVVDGEEQVVGILSDRDLRAAFGNPEAAALRDSAADEELKVRDWMSRPAITVEPGESCVTAARLFANRSIGALPVVGAEDRLVGILSYVDVLRSLATHIEK